MKNKCIRLLSVLIVLLLIQTITQATYLLPTSHDIWHGSKVYTQNGYNAYVEYAVYMTASAPSSVVDSTLNAGTYTYAYKIVTSSTSAVLASLRLFSLTDLDLSTKGVGSVVDDAVNIAPDSSYNDGQDIVWDFLGAKFEGGNTSVNLVFTSDFAPVAGGFSLSGSAGDDAATPGTNTTTGTNNTTPTPEPATMTLLSIGVLSLFKKKLNKRS